VEGVVTAASLLVTGASAEQALTRACALAPALAVGLHLNLTEGMPAADATAVASLLAPTGEMRGKFGFRDALAAGEVDMEHVRVEVRAQLDRFRALHPAHAAPTHLDGHQHVHVLPRVAGIVAEEAAAAGIRWVRLPSGSEDLSGLAPPRRAFYDGIAADARAARAVFEHAGLAAPDAFIGYTTMGREATRGSVTAALAASGDARVVEWMTHPGYPVVPRPLAGGGALCTCRAAAPHHHAAWCSAAGSGVAVSAAAGCGPSDADDFAGSDDRAHEAELLTSHALRAALAAQGWATAPPPTGP